MLTEQMETSRWKSLIDTAWKVSDRAYNKYSGYQVGAALLCADGSVYTGCNVENTTYGATICAERTAVVKAVSEGNREYSAIAVVGKLAKSSGNDKSKYAMPCGICRQVLSEFTDPDTFMVVVANEIGDIRCYTLSELLPEAFY